MQVFAYGRGSAEFDRGVSFFDAVYGFAITLLITTVHPPGPKAMNAATRRGTVIGWVQDLVLPVVFLGSIPIAFLAGAHVAQDSWASLVILMPVLGRVNRAANGPLAPIKEGE